MDATPSIIRSLNHQCIIIVGTNAGFGTWNWSRGASLNNKRMLEGKAMVKETDMSPKMQIHAMASASQALDLYDVYDCISIAAHIKKEFDSVYGNGWQCVVGSNFGCYFTHSSGTFIYFALETLNFLIFKGTSS
ncbi:Dynein light chain 1, cytoplasmic [Glycine soja]